MSDPTPRVGRLGEHVWLVELGSTIDEDVNNRVLTLASSIRHGAWRGVRDVVPAFTSLAVHVSPGADHASIQRLLDELLAHPLGSGLPAESREIEIPVRYGGADGPDLDEVAALTGLSSQDVVERHAAQTYRVFMLGFLPGFAYLGTVPSEIQVPRRSSPRTRVAEGSVGLANAQTGVYPRESPGGWQIIGRTSRTLFDASAAVPSLLAPGDRVRFVPEDHTW